VNTLTLTELQFKQILDGTQHTVSRDDVRPALQHIRIDVSHYSITAYSLDGYRASRFILKCPRGNDDEFTCYIKPVPFKPSKNGNLPVKISADDESTILEFRAGYGRIQYQFERPNWDLKIEDIYAEAEAHDREVGANARYVAQAMQAIAKMNNRLDHCCVIEGKADPLSPMLIRAKGENMENTQLILPIRLLEGSKE
jgi:DNA polymerase III sliding clamp (beta) subunit (PCNA family)